MRANLGPTPNRMLIGPLSGLHGRIAGEVSEKCSGVRSLPARSAVMWTPLPTHTPAPKVFGRRARYWVYNCIDPGRPKWKSRLSSSRSLPIKASIWMDFALRLDRVVMAVLLCE